MPELKNRRHEKFVQCLHIFKNKAKAVRMAGYSSKNSDVTSQQLLNREDIQERLKEVEEENITEVNFNVDVVEELEKQYDSAQKKHNITGALKALELIQKVRGNKSSNEIEISVESLEENIINCLNRISTEKVKELLLKSNHSKIILQLESNIEQLQQHQEKISQESQE